MNYELASKLWYYSEGEIYWNLSIGQQKKGKIAGYKHEKAFYKHVKYKGKYYYCHRIIYLLHHKYLPKYIDHINKIKIDNRIDNLRECSVSQNIANNNGWHHKDLPKGVSKNGNGFIARIMINGKQIRLGTYKTIEEAECIYKQKSKEVHGEFSFA